MNLNIRRAQTADAQAIAAILRELDWFAHLASETLETTQMRVSQHLEMCLANDSHSVYVAQTEPSEIMGYVAVHWMPTLFGSTQISGKSMEMTFPEAVLMRDFSHFKPVWPQT
jgi:hypothetical protein